MSLNDGEKDYKKWKRAFVFIVLAIIAFRLIANVEVFYGWLNTFLSRLSPFFTGFCLAYLLNMPFRKIKLLIEKSKVKFFVKKSRGFAILITYSLFILVIYIGLRIIVPAMSSSLMVLINNLPTYYDDIIAKIEELNVSGYLNNFVDMGSTFSMDKILSSINTDMVMGYLGGILQFSNSILNFFLAIVSSVYFLIEAENFKIFAMKALSAVFKEKHLNVFYKYLSNINTYFYKFFYCQIIDAAIVGVTATIVLTLLGVTYAPILGPLLGLFNIIPYFGTMIGVVLIIVVALFADGLAMALAAGAFLIILQQIDGSIIQPKLLGGSLSISPILIIIGITLGGAYFGVIGMIIAIPIVASLKSILMDYIEYRENEKVEVE